MSYSDEKTSKPNQTPSSILASSPEAKEEDKPMLTPEQIDKIDDEDTKYAFARVPWRSYIYRSRDAEFKKDENGLPPDEWEAKRVMDSAPSLTWAAPKKSKGPEVVLLEEGDRRRIEWRATFVRSPRGIKRVQVHKWSVASGRPYKDRGLSIPVHAIPGLIGFFKLVLSLPDEHIKHKARFDDDYVGDLVARVANDKRTAREMNSRHPELLRALMESGVDPDTLASLLADGGATIKSMFAAMIKLGGREAVLQQLADSGVSDHDIAILTRRREQTNLFSDLIHNDEVFEQHLAALGGKLRQVEKVWGNFFERNRWIFGYGLSIRWLSGLDNRRLELTVSGSDILQGKGVRMDAVLRTRGALSSLCFVEIKHHKTRLMHKESYRGEAWVPSHDLAGGVAQVQRGVWKAMQGSGWNKVGVDVPVVPRSILVIGSLTEFRGEDGGVLEDIYRSFELYRRSVQWPEIITFDELYERCRHIVDGSGDEPPGS